MHVFVRAFPRSRVQWLDVLARSARSASAPRRGRKTGPHAAKHTAAKERANARTKTRKPQGNARDSIIAGWPARRMCAERNWLTEPGWRCLRHVHTWRQIGQP